jgi:CxxC-x17-CxxC domain-containing protein
MSDRTLTCRDCGQTFTFTAGEQAFYQERGFSEPTRCKACRDKRKAERNASGSGGYDSYGGSSYGGSSSGGYGASGRDYNSAPRQMYPAICSSCGKETEVPFEPRNDKPVFCRECFQAQRASTPRYGSSY